MKVKQCGKCLNDFPSLWKAKKKLPNGEIQPAMCKSCALKDSTPIGRIKITNKTTQDVKTPKPISKQSDKEKKRQAAYYVLKKEYMKRKYECEAKLIGCMYVPVDIHHLFSGADRSKYFLDDSTWKAVCRNCHQKIHDELSSEQLIELGLRQKE